MIAHKPKPGTWFSPGTCPPDLHGLWIHTQMTPKGWSECALSPPSLPLDILKFDSRRGRWRYYAGSAWSPLAYLRVLAMRILKPVIVTGPKIHPEPT